MPDDDRSLTTTTTTLSPKEIEDELYRQLEDAEEQWQQYAFTFQPSTICAECAGLGYIPSGSLGNAQCWECGGKRIVAHPEPDEVRKIHAPDFDALRRAIKGNTYDPLVMGRKIRDELAAAKKSLKEPPKLPGRGNNQLGDGGEGESPAPRFGSLGDGGEVDHDE